MTKWQRFAPCALLAALVGCGSDTDPNTDGSLTPPVPAATQPEIPFPPELFTRGIEGEVLLYVVVDSAGLVIRDSTRIAKSSGHVEFDAAAMAAAPGLLFSPATRDGAPIMHPIQVPIRFTIPDSIPGREDSIR